MTTTFETGHIVGLLGLNGAGKSTLIKILVNHIFPDSGDVYIDDREYYTAGFLKKEIFRVGEDNPFIEDKVINIYKIFAQANNINLDLMLELAKRFELDVNKQWKKLSTGYRTIFKSILALSSNAKFVIFDEPVLGLDAKFRSLFYTTLLEYFTPDRCFIISTHLIEEISQIIDEVKIIYKGKLIKDESLDELLQDVYIVSGSLESVEKATEGLDIINKSVTLNKASYVIKGKLTPNDNVTLNNITLQDYFINICK